MNKGPATLQQWGDELDEELDAYFELLFQGSDELEWMESAEERIKPASSSIWFSREVLERLEST